eukprot:6178793-Pleurochrysis_carterae.AAC.5
MEYVSPSYVCQYFVYNEWSAGCSNPYPILRRGGNRLAPAYRVRQTDHPRKQARHPDLAAGRRAV